MRRPPAQSSHRRLRRAPASDDEAGWGSPTIVSLRDLLPSDCIETPVKHLRKPVRVAAQMAKFSILRHIEADNQQSGAFPRLATTVAEKNGNVFAAAPARGCRLFVSLQVGGPRCNFITLGGFPGYPCRFSPSAAFCSILGKRLRG
jgi:hypothetical protein